MNSTKDLMVTAIQDLIISRNNIFDNIVNVAMSGDSNHLADAVDVGERYEFKMNHFRNMDDENVNALIEICDLIEEFVPVLMDRNNIDVTELNFEN